MHYYLMEGYLFPMLVHMKKRNMLVGFFSAHLEVTLWLVCRIAVAAET